MLDNSGPVLFERADTETWPEILESFFRLHAARWRERDEPGVVSDDRVRAFHREVARGMTAAGRLRLYRLVCGETIAAALYGFALSGRFYAYLGGFEPALAQASPGTLLTGFAIERAIEEGIREYDLLRGKEPHKYVWGAADRPAVRLIVGKGRSA